MTDSIVDEEITDYEKKLLRALVLLINLHEDAINKHSNYCMYHCPVGYAFRHKCPAEFPIPQQAADYCVIERDYSECMELQVQYYLEKANNV